MKRLLAQLNEASGPQAAGAIQRVLDHWTGTGGLLIHGTSAGASCGLSLKSGGHDVVIGRMYAKTFEIPFGMLLKRPPFDELALREELRARLNDAPGVDIPVAKLNLYPSIPNTRLADPAVFDVVVATLDWFASLFAEVDNGPPAS